MPMFEDALAGKLKMLWVVGQNPAVTLSNLTLTFEAMAKLEMLVVQEIWETETAAFWKRPGADPKSIATEVILLPAAFFMEKNGTISNSGGMVQWRHAAVKPPGQAKPDGEIVDLVFRKVRDLVKDSKEPRDEIIRNAFWTYTTAEDVLREINGYALRDNPETGLKKGDLIRKVSDLKSDGSTSSGAWIYAGVFANGENLSKRRDATDRSGRPRPLPGLRLDLAEQHADPLQPRVVRPERQAVPGLEADHLVGRGGEALDRARRAGRAGRDRRPRHAERPARVPPRRGGCRPPLRGRLLGPRPEVHGILARRGLRAEGRPAAGDVRADREPGGKRPAPGREQQPDGEVSARPVASADRHRRQIPLRADDLDGRRTLVLRLDDAEHPLAQRALSRTGARAAHHPRSEARREIGRLGARLVGAR